MYQRKAGSYDEIPEGMKQYINNYGCHFNKKLCEEAAKRMYTVVGGKKEYIRPYRKEDVDRILETYGIKVQRNEMHDYVYVANMCKADFLGKSVPDEAHLAQYVRDVIDDSDAEPGFIFNRYYADCMFMDNPIDWDEVL